MKRNSWRAWPYGLLGALALVAGVEALLARARFDLANVGTARWRYANKAARVDAKAGRVLCFGTSLVTNGVVPWTFAEESGQPSYNLSVFNGPIPASYYLFHRALKSRARPRLVVFDRQ